LLTSTM